VKLPNKPRPLADQISELTTNRLSVYLRCLDTLDQAGVRTISSKTLAEQFHLNAAQIRKDLAYFGEFGVRGVGYYVKELKRHLRQILGLDREVRVAIVGAGNLGLAMAKSVVFGAFIALIGCLEGFQVQGTAQSVGERTTSSVVQSISLVILLDAFAAMFFMEMNW